MIQWGVERCGNRLDGSKLETQESVVRSVVGVYKGRVDDECQWTGEGKGEALDLTTSDGQELIDPRKNNWGGQA